MAQEHTVPENNLLQKAEQWMQSKGRLQTNDSSMYSLPQSSFEDDHDNDSPSREKSSTQKRRESVSSFRSTPHKENRKQRRFEHNTATPAALSSRANNDMDSDWDDYGSHEQTPDDVLNELDPIQAEIPLTKPHSRHASAFEYPHTTLRSNGQHDPPVPELDYPRPAPISRRPMGFHTTYIPPQYDKAHTNFHQHHRLECTKVRQDEEQSSSPVFLPQNIPKTWVTWIKRLIGAVVCGIVIAVIFVVTEPSFLQEPVASDVVVAPLSVSRTGFVVGCCILGIVVADAIDSFLRSQRM